MNLSNLSKITWGHKKRVGRGIGSGKGGHTTGRGTKGQKAREKTALGFEGTKMKKSLLKKLPLLRGKGKLKGGNKPAILNLTNLANWPDKMVVNRENLIKAGLIEIGKVRVKILGQGEAKRAMVVKVPVSKGAREKIETAGGRIEA